jgi:predicted transcriptional regulator
MVSLSIIGMTGWVNPLRMAIRRPGTLSVARRWSGGAFFVCTPGGGRRGAQERYSTLQRAHRRGPRRASASLGHKSSSWAQGQQGGRQHLPQRRGALGGVPGPGLPQRVPPALGVRPPPGRPARARTEPGVERGRRPWEPQTLAGHTSLTRHDRQAVLPWRERGACRTTTTMRVALRVRALLQELAQASGRSRQGVVEQAVEQYRRQQQLAAPHAADAALRAHPEAGAPLAQARLA